MLLKNDITHPILSRRDHRIPEGSFEDSVPAPNLAAEYQIRIDVSHSVIAPKHDVPARGWRAPSAPEVASKYSGGFRSEGSHGPTKPESAKPSLDASDVTTE